MITKEQYLEAIQICEKYIEQEKARVNNIIDKYNKKEKENTFEEWESLKKGDKIKILRHTLNRNSKLQNGDIVEVTYNEIGDSRRKRRCNGFKELRIGGVEVNSKRKYQMIAEFHPDPNDFWFYTYWRFEKISQ